VILYLTYNDQPSGVYWSQVTDVVAHLDALGGPRVRLVALVSGRGYFAARRAIHERSPSAWVLPMVPKMRFWRWNVLLLAWVCCWLRPTGIIARGVFATWMARRMRAWRLTRKVCFDGRGAYAAEWEEYRLIDDDALIAQFRPLEHAAVHHADMRLAVSHALVEHWSERYGWKGDDYVVVPCALGVDHATTSAGSPAGDPAVPPTPTSAGSHGVDPAVQKVPTSAGSHEVDPAVRKEVVLVYSGSTAGWQSFALLKELLIPLLEGQPHVRVLFLSKPDANNKALQEQFPGRVEVRWAKPAEVAGILAGCDHGLLIREDTITNRVASPTKFAEYLAAGLPILISAHIGDFSATVREHDLGTVWEAGAALPELTRTDAARRTRMQAYAAQHLTKAAFDGAYRRILGALS